METQVIRFDGELRVCPECGYQDGFHTMLKARENGMKWLFICPSCHQVFDIGYTLPGLPGDPASSGE